MFLVRDVQMKYNEKWRFVSVKKRMVSLLFGVLLMCCMATAGYCDTVMLPSGITAIADETFYGDVSLDTVMIPDGVTSIGKLAFAGSGIKRIMIPDSVTHIEDDAFEGVRAVMIVSSAESAARIFADNHSNCYWEARGTLVIFSMEDKVLEGTDVLISAYMTGNSYSDGTGTIDETASQILWERSADGENWEIIDGENSEDLVFRASGPACSYQYRCRYSEGTQNYISNSLSVDMLLRVTVQGASLAGEGETVTLSAIASNAVSYRWQQSPDGETWTDSTLPGNNTDKLVFTANPTTCACQYRCIGSDQYGFSGISEAFTIQYVLRDLVIPSSIQDLSLQKETMGTMGFSLWGEQNVSFSFPADPNVDSYIIRCSTDPEMRDCTELDTGKGYESCWAYNQQLADWQYDSNILLVYTDSGGETGQYPLYAGHRLYTETIPENVVEWECTVYGLKYDKTYYITLEAVGEGFESEVSEPLVFTAASIDSAQNKPTIQSSEIENGVTVVRYGIETGGEDFTHVLVFRSWGGGDFISFLDVQSRTDADFGRWEYYTSSSEYDWFSFATYNEEKNTVSDLVVIPPGAVKAVAASNKTTALDGTEVLITCTAPTAQTYNWQYSENDGSTWLDIENQDQPSKPYYGVFSGYHSSQLRYVSRKSVDGLKYRCLVYDQYGNTGISNIIQVVYKPDWRNEVPKLYAKQKGTVVELSWLSEERAPAYAIYEVNGSSATLLKRVTGSSYNLSNVTSGRHTYRIIGCSGTGSGATNANCSSNDATLIFTVLTLNQTTATVYEGTRPNTTLKITNPANADVQWSSENPSIASVSSAGIVTGISGGSVNIVAKVNTSYGYASASCKVTVNPRTYRALLVGQYDYVAKGIREAGVNDVKTMSAVLGDASFRDGNAYTRTYTVDARKAKIQSDISSAFAEADENDVSLFLYSGHGYTEKSGTYAGALALSSGEYISGQELAYWLSGVNGSKVVFLQSCGSGALIGRGAEDNTGSGNDDSDNFNEAIIQAFREADTSSQYGFTPRNSELAVSGFYVISGSATGESAFRTVGKHGMGFLTTALINGMGYYTVEANIYRVNGIPADSNLDGGANIQELYNYANAAITRWTDEMHIKLYNSNAQQFDVFRK